MMGRALQARLAQALPDLPARSLRLFFQQAAHDAMISQEPGVPCYALCRVCAIRSSLARLCNARSSCLCWLDAAGTSSTTVGGAPEALPAGAATPGCQPGPVHAASLGPASPGWQPQPGLGYFGVPAAEAPCARHPEGDAGVMWQAMAEQGGATVQGLAGQGQCHEARPWQGQGQCHEAAMRSGAEDADDRHASYAQPAFGARWHADARAQTMRGAATPGMAGANGVQRVAWGQCAGGGWQADARALHMHGVAAHGMAEDAGHAQRIGWVQPPGSAWHADLRAEHLHGGSWQDAADSVQRQDRNAAMLRSPAAEVCPGVDEFGVDEERVFALDDDRALSQSSQEAEPGGASSGGGAASALPRGSRQMAEPADCAGEAGDMRLRTDGATWDASSILVPPKFHAAHNLRGPSHTRMSTQRFLHMHGIVPVGWQAPLCAQDDFLTRRKARAPATKPATKRLQGRQPKEPAASPGMQPQAVAREPALAVRADLSAAVSSSPPGRRNPTRAARPHRHAPPRLLSSPEGETSSGAAQQVWSNAFSARTVSDASAGVSLSM